MASEHEVVQRQLNTDHDPAGEIVETVADLRGTDVSNLAQIWDCLDVS